MAPVKTLVLYYQNLNQLEILQWQTHHRTSMAIQFLEHMSKVSNSHQLVAVIVVLAFIIKNKTECKLILHRFEV